MGLVWQESLFGGPAPEDKWHAPPMARLGFDRMRRLPLDEHSWLDLAPGWFPKHADLFGLLLEQAPWQQRERRMFGFDEAGPGPRQDRVVLEPRLVAAWSAEELGALPPPIARIRAAVGARYGVEFDSVLINLYRDGRDGVAWHGDRVRHRMREAVVVTVGLGERRRFLLRPGTSGPPTHRFTSGEGDLIVMGGRCQSDWQHTVPKSARAGARMSITMRHSAPLPGAEPLDDAAPDQQG